jgi:benzoyl-CoA reductase/2-hydroxyglutaryl-CoA dehydratase subunit BcrC/BadD/HgdB
MDPGLQLRILKDQGRRIIACFPLYPPLPLFHSMGLVPIVLWGLRGHIPRTEAGDRHLPPYTCSVARHLTEFLLTEGRDLVDGIFMYNACDTLRNLPEILMEGLIAAGRDMPFFQMHLPMPPREQTDASAYFENEISALVNDLSVTFGTVFSSERFQFSTVLYQRMRHLALEAEDRVAAGRIAFSEFAQVMQAGAFTPVEDHIQALTTLISSAAAPRDDRKSSGFKRPRVMLSGIMPPPSSVLSAIESAGLTVAANDIASLFRGFAAMPGPRTDPESFFQAFYDDHYPCPTLLYTGDRRVAALLDRIEQKQIDAVIFVGEKFCEYEYFEIPSLVEAFAAKGIPTLQLEIAMEDDPHSAGHDARIAAFAEMIR